MVSLLTMENALKQAYLDVFRNQVANSHPLLTLANNTKGTNNVYGKDVILLDNEGKSHTYPLKDFRVKIQLSDKALRAAQNSSGALVNLLNSEVEDAITDASEQLQKELMQSVLEKHLVVLPMHKYIIADFCIEKDIVAMVVGKKAKQLMLKKNIIDATGEFAGHKCLYSAHTPVIYDNRVAEDEIVFIPTSAIQQQELCDWCWLEDENNRILRQAPGKPVFEASLVKYARILTKSVYFMKLKQEGEENGKN